MENKMGTLADDKDGEVSPDPLHSPEHDTETMDEDRTPDTETPNRKCPTCGRAETCINSKVTGSKDSIISDSTVIGVFNKTVLKNEKQQEGVTCNVTEGAKPRVKISVPAKDGRTKINFECINGKLEHWSYSRKVDTENKLGSRWIFRNIFEGLMADIINKEKIDDLIDLIEKWEKLYRCEWHKIVEECLVIEFLHETEEGRDRMIKEKETVKQMFQIFIEGINPNASSCTLEVSTEKETTPSSDKPDTELKHIEQDVSEDVSVPSTSKSEQAQAQGMMPREYKKEERFQSVSDDESERPLRKEKEYSVDDTETSYPFDVASLLPSDPLASLLPSDPREIKETFRKQRKESHPGVIGGSDISLEPILYPGTIGGSDISPEPILYPGTIGVTYGSRERVTYGSRERVTYGSRERETFESSGFDEEETSFSFDSDEEETSFPFHYLSGVGHEPIPVSQVYLHPGTIDVEREPIPVSQVHLHPGTIDVEREPIPVSEVHLHNCGRCSEVLQNCENELSALPNLHFIHFNPNFRKTSKLQFTKILSALRNSGGVLLVHHHYPAGSGLDSLNRFINQISDSVLTRDVVTCVTCEVFKTQRIRNYEDMFRIDVQPSEMYVTHDYKTKFPSLSTGEFENASNERIRHLLFSSRTTESTEAALKGISSRQQNVEDLRLRYSRPTPMLSGPSEPPRHMLNVLVDDIDVDDIMTSHSVPEHITSLSKKKSGGSMFVVMAGLTFDDTPLRQQERFKARLMQTLKKNLRVQKNKHSKVSLQDIDVFKIGLSKDADSGDCILEIAVGHVNGCVFYDPQGPESYKIEGEKIVRLPIERWVEEAFE